jgi:dTMP kinase
MTGRFITIEGIEGAGKSTQLSYIQQYLEKHNKTVVVTREPGGTELSEKIRDLLLTPMPDAMAADTELLLMFAGRAEHVAKVIKPALARGDWVLSDRFTDATFAYQGGGRGVSEQRIQQLLEWTLGDLKPDLTLLFDLNVELGQQRVEKRNEAIDRFEQEKIDFFQRIRDCYLQIASREPERVRVIDSSETIAAIQQQLTQILAPLV